MTIPTRRQFLQHATVAGAAAGAAMTLPTRRLLAAGADEPINIGIVGCGWRGGQLLGDLLKLPGVQITGLCDPDSELMGKLGEKVPKARKWADMQDLFKSSDIDAVVIATCNHWHCLAAVWAMEAGKHVYVEKPLGHTQWEGQQVINASAKYQRICQVGTQQRSNPMQTEIKQFLHKEKAIGNLESVRVNRFGVRKSIGLRTTPMKPPKNIDYNLWLGPAQDLPIYRDKFHYDWHWSWNTGSGEMGNWGVHILDDVRNNLFQDLVAAPKTVTAAGGRFAWNDAGDTSNVHFALLDAGGVPVVVTLSNLPVDKLPKALPGPDNGYIAYCEGGRLEGGRGGAAAFDSAGKLIKEFSSNGRKLNALHLQNFLDAIRQDQPSLLIAPAQIGHDSTTWCNLVNIATRVPKLEDEKISAEGLATNFGSESAATILKQMHTIILLNDSKHSAEGLQLGPTLQYDSELGQFVGEHAAAANKMVRREYREPFTVPEVAMPNTAKSKS